MYLYKLIHKETGRNIIFFGKMDENIEAQNSFVTQKSNKEQSMYPLTFTCDL